MIYAADKALRDFLGISSIRNPAIFNNRNYEDPTYPIFHIKFAFNPPEAKHPDYVTNRLLSKLEDESSAINDESAIKYLYNVGEPDRAVMLKKFNIALRSISEKTPWYFQKIDRLPDLYKHAYETESRGERELSPVVLTINTLESIDYKILSLKDLYRKVAYDRKFRRWVLPVNLRRFRMSIMIGDYRQMAITEDNFSISGRSALSTLRDIDIFNSSNVGGQLVDRVQEGQIDFIKRLQWWDNHFSCVVFDCQDCEFDMNSSFNPDSIDHSGQKNPQSNAFKIKVGRVLETNTYSLLEYILSDNTFENFLKSSDKDKVLTQSKKLKEVVKPVVSSWKSFPNLEREKGNNRRIILDDNGVGQAVRGTINEALDFLGLDSLFEGTNLGQSGGFLGSVGDFFGDTLSGVAQELIGQATEQLVTNIFTDEFLQTTAGIGLGILGGDIRNGNRTRNPNQPNLRDNIPTKLNLDAPGVQRSLTDVQANLSGEGADPRFRSIGRPGRNLFITPETDLSLEGNQRVFVQESLYLEPPRVETEMPDNIEFDETRKETTLSPDQANLSGAGKKTDLTPNNANLNGAQPLDDLIPNNADLNGAQPLKDLIPNNADLNGAQPLKDLIPNNADLNGAQPLDDLTPNQIELNGANPQTQLTPESISLLGADPIKSFSSAQVQLEGPQPISELVPTNVTLEGANKIETLITKQVILEGTNPIDAFNKSNVDLSGSPVSSTFETKTVNLIGAESLTKFNEINTNLEGSQPIEKINQQNIDFQNNIVSTSFNSENIELVEPKTLRNLIETRADLTSPSVLKSISETNAELSGSSVQTRISETSVELEGSKKIEITSKNINLSGNSPLKEINDSNIELVGSRPKTEKDIINEPLEGSEPLRSITQRNVGDMTVKESIPITSLGTEELTGKKPLNDILEPNANLIGAKPLEKIIDDNVKFEKTNKSITIDKNFKLKGAPAIKSLNEDSLDYKGVASVNGIPNSYRSKGIYSDSLSNNKTSTNNDIKPIINEDFTLEGAEPMTELNPTNVNLHSKNVEQDINYLGNVQFEVRRLNNNLSADKNLGLQASLTQRKQSISNLELKGNESYTINPNYENQGFIGDPKKQNMPTENIQLDEQKTPTPIKSLNVGVQIK